MTASHRLWRARPARVARPLLLAAAVIASGAAATGCSDDEPVSGDSRAEVAAAETTPAVPREDTGAPSWGEKPTAEAEAGDTPYEDAAPEAPAVEDAPVVAPPAPAPPVRPPEASGEVVDRDDHVDFALDFLGRQGYNSVPGFMELYGERVRYYDRGTVPQEAVAEDKAGYFERWPNRYFELDGPVRATRGASPTLRFDYAFAVSHADLSGEREGRAWVELGLSPLPGGDAYVITSERGGTY